MITLSMTNNSGSDIHDWWLDISSHNGAICAGIISQLKDGLAYRASHCGPGISVVHVPARTEESLQAGWPLDVSRGVVVPET